MASCPNCYEEKPFWATNCAKCCQKVTVGEQASFSILSTLFTIAILAVILKVLF